MRATTVVLIEVTDPKVYHYFIMFVSMMYVLCTYVYACVCVYFLMSNCVYYHVMYCTFGSK